ncbi:hypothetical protein NUH88_04800 [Nisaea acidiphila]|uniref:Bromoperoxidase n=1 Tax=Nisaea acidiphila TaxID=1862145 RepID=A0A9J7ATJ5_9PROT|nr:hypothetical protein [Nisaea acidiphila]UUX51011.1 hypothetical protein NUH88_04800 [Nisaea acidiphila]
MTSNRREEAFRVRVSAAEKAKGRVHPAQKANGDEQRYASANYAMSFTKGLEHSSGTGLIERGEDFVGFRRAVDNGFIVPFTTEVRAARKKERAWEAPTAGVVYSLEGPDAQAVTMPPAPALGSDELAYEMAEVYELAVLRDVPLTAFRDGSGNAELLASLDRLNHLAYAKAGYPDRPRLNVDGDVTPQTAFRGSSPGVGVGPYLSQFMLIGNTRQDGGGPADGIIQYGALQIDQKVPIAADRNWMTTWNDWLCVQNGEDVRNNSTLFAGGRRFICVPRDLATYVHDDALYEAYLNACLILLGMKSDGGAPFDPSFESLSGEGNLFMNSLASYNYDSLESHPWAAGGFALFGGPHILTLVTEVATRALKAVRFQKFNTHMRLRPEALAARIEKAAAIDSAFPVTEGRFGTLVTAIEKTVDAVRAINPSNEALLPMAFQEGSPMHPSYGAGHAAVAGACVTMLKAFFDTDAVLLRRGDKVMFARYQAGDQPVHYVPNANGSALEEICDGPFLSLEAELNKLAANISIGRNMGGVHYFADYYDSVRLGEKVALGILEEQALCYRTDPFVLSVPTFDGDVVRVGAR